MHVESYEMVNKTSFMKALWFEWVEVGLAERQGDGGRSGAYNWLMIHFCPVSFEK